MSSLHDQNKRKKKEGHFVFLLVIVCLIVPIFSVMNDSFAEEKSQECGIDFQEIDDKGFMFIPVKDEQKILEPCDLRSFNDIMYNKTKGVQSGLPHNWFTGLILYRIGNIDTVAGTYDMYFNYWVEIFEEDDPANFTVKLPDIDFVNMVGVPEKIEKTKGIIQTNHYYDIMVSGTFYTNMDFKKFPFEKLDLNVILEPSYDVDLAGGPTGYPTGSQNDSIQFHIWPWPGLNREGVPSPGYKIVAYNLTETDHQYDVGDIYSRYVANFEVERQTLDSFLKFIFPIMIMSILAIATVLFPSEMYMTKISLNAIFLIGILFFVQTVQEKIPNIGDMTIFDYVVIMSYGIIVVVIMTPTMKWKRRKAYELDKAKRDDWKDKDRRNHDLNMENLRRTEADIVFFKDNLKKCTKGTDEHKKITEVITHLNDRRANLDKLKNIDLKISLLAKKRTELSEEQILYAKNLSPAEIRRKVDNYTKGKEKAFTQNERQILEQIKKPLEEYEKTSADILSRKKKSGDKDQIIFDSTMQAKLKIQKMALNNAWKKSRKIIRKEEMLEDKGTILQLDELEDKREDVVDILIELEKITEDNRR